MTTYCEHEFDGVRWLFFDMGSTLVDESAVYADRFQRVAEAAGTTAEAVTEQALAFYRENRKGDAEVIRLTGVKKPAWRTELETLYPDAETCLKSLRGQYRIGILANQEPGTAHRLESFGIARYIDLIIASAEEGVSKPDPRIFALALARAGCRPEEAAMIGDRVDNDIVPAKEAGMKTVWVRRGYGKYWRVSGEAETADAAVDTLAELTALLTGRG